MKKINSIAIILTFIAILFILTQQAILIEQFGALPNQDTIQAQFKNSEAIVKAIYHVNSSDYQFPDDRVVILSKSKKYYTMPILIDNVSNVTFTIYGKMIASKSFKYWPNVKLNYQDYLVFINCKNITLNGGGKIDGRGYHWWLANILQNKKYMPPSSKRPHLINFIMCNGVQFHDLTLKNSPSFHLKTTPSQNVRIFNLNIKVNTTAQFNLIKKFSLEGIIPVFPLNTDGIDPQGPNHHIFNITCQNYDDVVVPKPYQSLSNRSETIKCTQNMLIQNISIVLGVGLSVGSVPPNRLHNCIRNITFRNSYMKRPFKGIYLKTNPGYVGTGEIKDILYENIEMDRPVWWAIYLGPQQQKQPGGGGPGCMFYPYDPKGTCETQPRIDIRNVTMKNVKIHKSLLFPYVFRCNQTNPCTGINLENVKTDEWVINKNKAKGYVCQFVHGKQLNSYPKMDCLEEQKIESQFKKELVQKQIKVINNLERQDFLTLEQIYKDPKLLKRVLKQMKQANQQFPYFDQDDDQMGSDDMSFIDEMQDYKKEGYIWSIQ